MATALIWHSVAFVVVTALLVTLLARARVALPWRLAVTVLAGGAYIAHYNGLLALTGWPSREPLPAEFDVLGMRVVEPSRDGKASGRIELWIGAPGDDESRLYRLPYSAGLHEQVADARRRQAEGRDQRGRSHASRQGGTGEGAVSIEDKPPPRLPSKRRD